MSEENQKAPLVAPPGWTEAMQGKVGNANRVKASKRVFVVLSLTFFGIFMWLYIIYSLGHPKKAQSAGGETPVTASAPVGAEMGGAVQSGMPVAAAMSPFGMPRGAEAAMAQGMPQGQGMLAQSQAMPGVPQGQAMSQGQGMNAAYGVPTGAFNPYATAAYTPNQAAGGPAAAPGAGFSPAMGGPIPLVPQNRGGVTITAPREFRHGVGVAGGSLPGMPTIASQRMRTFVSR
jgi:hypothetical protein